MNLVNESICRLAGYVCTALHSAKESVDKADRYRLMSAFDAILDVPQSKFSTRNTVGYSRFFTVDLMYLTVLYILV
jgi:hypothetical protein